MSGLSGLSAAWADAEAARHNSDSAISLWCDDEGDWHAVVLRETITCACCGATSRDNIEGRGYAPSLALQDLAIKILRSRGTK